MRRLIGHLVIAAALVCLGHAVADAQGTATSQLSGVVVDAGGAVIPGASVVVKDTSTGATFEVTTNSTGAFSVPALNPGTYSVTAALSGFKTSVVKDIRLLPALPVDIKVVLEIGNLEETITVTGASELVQTRSATVSSTVNVDQINTLPLPTRNAVNFITYLAGVNTTGTNRDSIFNGLPRSAVAISLDGVNNNENYNKSTEGLFAMITPRQDAVEAVTVTTAVPGSESGGHGTVSIQFVTRAGTDRFSGSVYEYMRRPGLNTNYYFNDLRGLPKNQVKIDQYGFRIGGPIVIPGLYNGRGKAFFFFNYEEFRMPNDFSRTRTILAAPSQNGLFQYSAAGGIQQVDLYALAARFNQTSTPDPTVASVLGAIRSAAASTGNVLASSDPNISSYNFMSAGDQIERQPTARLDYQVNAGHRLTGTWTHQLVDRDPDHLNGADVRFPGAPNYRHYVSDRNIASAAVRSVFGGSLVNELRGGLKWGPSFFGKPEWQGPSTFADQGGRALVLGTVGQALTNWHTNNAPNGRSAWSWNIDETLNWQKGAHAVRVGGSYFDGHMWSANQTMVPQINFGVDSADPANAMFTTLNFPGASSSQLTAAKSLYALLTGRVTAITANARLDEKTGKYVLLGERALRLRQQEFGLFVQDTWRISQSVTVNAGIRWDLQLPIETGNDIVSTSTYADLCGVSGVGSQYGCNMFQPGTLTGRAPTYQQYDQGSPGYETDWTNFAPSIGVAWRPFAKRGFWRRVLGDPEQATLRAGYSQAFNREGMALFYGVYDTAQGSTVDVIRNSALGNIVGAGETWPVLLRDSSRMWIPSFPETPSYPMAATVANSISVFDPNIKVALGRSITASFQRALTKDMAFEVRYSGTFGRRLWSQENLNLDNINIIENGFLQEFKVAMANLQANIAAGKGSTFAFTGASGTAPLPIILAYFQGLPASQAGTSANYKSSLFTDSTFVNLLAPTNPQPCCGTTTANPSFAYNLFNNATRRANAIAAGLPPNFFVVNPGVTNANIYRSNAWTNYNALQIELRRRLSGGLQFTTNYQYARSYGSRNLGVRYPLASQLNLAGLAQPAVPPHAFKLMWNYSLPVGRGRRFGAGMRPWLDALIGGWEINGAGRAQIRWLDFGNVRLVGMSVDELRDMYKVRIDPDPRTGVMTVYMLPQDVIDNTIKAFSTSATSPSGYSALGPPEGRYLAPPNTAGCIQLKPGDCAALNTYVRSPIFTRFDMSLAKRFRFTDRMNFELRFDVMNVFDNVNFNYPGTMAGSSQTMGQVTSAYTDMSNTFDPGGRLGQFVFRFSW